MISQQFEHIFETLTAEERREVEFFAAFVIARRASHKKNHVLTDDVSSSEFMKLLSDAGSFDWLRSTKEDIYSEEDGDAVQWPQES